MFLSYMFDHIFDPLPISANASSFKILPLDDTTDQTILATFAPYCDPKNFEAAKTL